MKYKNLHKLDENLRIDQIGKAAETSIVGVILETDQPDKINRYISKITKKYPKVKLISNTSRFTEYGTLVKFGPKITH